MFEFLAKESPIPQDGEGVKISVSVAPKGSS
jgi:hypothetical protein